MARLGHRRTSSVVATMAATVLVASALLTLGPAVARAELPFVEILPGPVTQPLVWQGQHSVNVRGGTVSNLHVPLDHLELHVDGVLTKTVSCDECFELRTDMGPFVASDTTVGPHELRAVAVDSGGQRAEHRVTFNVRIDREGPIIDVEGGFVDQLSAGASFGADDDYDLWVETTDGTATTPGSGVRELRYYVDGALKQRTPSDCVGRNSCDMEDVWSFDPTSLADGTHVIRLEVEDTARNTSTRSWNVQVRAANEPPLDAPEPFGVGRAVSGDGATPMQTRCAINTRQPSNATLVVNGRWPGGTETTEYFTSTDYEVSRCDTTGRFLRAEHVATIPVPSGAAPMILSKTWRKGPRDMRSVFYT